MTQEEKAQRMAALVAEIEQTERAKREVTKEFREQLTTLWKELEKLAGDVRDGQMSIDAAEAFPALKNAANQVTEKLAQTLARLDAPETVETPLLESLRRMCPRKAGEEGMSITVNNGEQVWLTFEIRQRIDAELKRRKAAA